MGWGLRGKSEAVSATRLRPRMKTRTRIGIGAGQLRMHSCHCLQKQDACSESGDSLSRLTRCHDEERGDELLAVAGDLLAWPPSSSTPLPNGPDLHDLDHGV